MRQLLNTLFVTSEDIYLSLEGENVLASRGGQQVARYPLHTLEGIVSFSYSGASVGLMGACARRGISLAFCTPGGRFQARICGEGGGNVLLRRAQYRAADDPIQSCRFARGMVFGKLYNARQSLERACRDHALRLDVQRLTQASFQMKEALPQVAAETNLDSLRGIEGAMATVYFGVWEEMILADKDFFCFSGRTRRPPMDPVNALLSFSYSLLANDCAAALESVGLDSYVGFLHRDRPGRTSLALDMMEELRPCMADRFVLTLINKRILGHQDFELRPGGAVFLNEKGKRTFLSHWQQKKREALAHPYLREKMAWGLIPYIQALLLSRCLRGELEEYPPFLWR